MRVESLYGLAMKPMVAKRPSSISVRMLVGCIGDRERVTLNVVEERKARWVILLLGNNHLSRWTVVKDMQSSLRVIRPCYLSKGLGFDEFGYFDPLPDRNI